MFFHMAAFIYFNRSSHGKGCTAKKSCQHFTGLRDIGQLRAVGFILTSQPVQDFCVTFLVCK